MIFSVDCDLMFLVHRLLLRFFKYIHTYVDCDIVKLVHISEIVVFVVAVILVVDFRGIAMQIASEPKVELWYACSGEGTLFKFILFNIYFKVKGKK